jgi:hypothetical protein
MLLQELSRHRRASRLISIGELLDDSIHTQQALSIKSKLNTVLPDSDFNVPTLFPLNRRWWFATYVIGNSVNPANFVDDAP